MKTTTALLLLALTLCGCDDDNDRNHRVPDGMGSLIVDNNTADEISVFVDGDRVGKIKSYRDKAYDLSPGVHRVVLDQSGGDRSYRDDVDILKGKRTILDVAVRAFDNRYDVVVFFD